MVGDFPKLSLTPRPGHPESKIVSRFVCPEGHVVQGLDKPSDYNINHIYPERALIPCRGCEKWYQVVLKPTVIEADDHTIEAAEREGYIDPSEIEPL